MTHPLIAKITDGESGQVELLQEAQLLIEDRDKWKEAVNNAHKEIDYLHKERDKYWMSLYSHKTIECDIWKKACELEIRRYQFESNDSTIDMIMKRSYQEAKQGICDCFDNYSGAQVCSCDKQEE